MATGTDTITSLLYDDMAPSANRKGEFSQYSTTCSIGDHFVNGAFVWIVFGENATDVFHAIGLVVGTGSSQPGFVCFEI